MTPITRWLEQQVTLPLDTMYARLDEHAAQLDFTPARTARDSRAHQAV